MSWFNMGSCGKLGALGLASFTALMAGTPIAHAEVQYSYVGPEFTTTTGPIDATGLTNVSGYFDTSTPLADNLVNSLITPDSMSFTDGVNIYAGPGGSGGYFAYITTDASGDIIDWSIVTPNIGSSNYNAPQIVTRWQDNSGTDASGALNRPTSVGSVSESGTEGTWTVSEVPEPMSAALLAGALGMLGAARRRSHRS